MRTAFKIQSIGCATFLLLMAGIAAYIAWGFVPWPPESALPPLVRDLPGPSPDVENKVFDERVRRRFPDGMPVQGLAEELKQEGFNLHRTNVVRESILYTPFEYAFVEQHGGNCPRRWEISWHFDQQGRARDIRGFYRLECPRFAS
jgi:hypothetical protein